MSVKDKWKEFCSQQDSCKSCKYRGSDCEVEFWKDWAGTKERENIIKEVDTHLKEAGYTYDSNMGIGDNIGSALLKEYADGYKKGEQDGRAEERAKTLAEVSIELDKYHNDICRASYPFNFIDKALSDVRRRTRAEE